MEKIAIQRARSSLSLATSDLHDYNDLHLYLDSAKQSLAAYVVAVEGLGALTERLAELEAA